MSRRGQVTDRFTKALERLGSEARYVRIGGVLALEQIVQGAPEQATHAAQVGLLTECGSSGDGMLVAGSPGRAAGSRSTTFAP
ncbi:hypothetical protein [Streptomyces albiflavescens]|uniref:hypothetical protein n=1 Tax=Streptomyces albiflavescens TaxID=1623582 RepID=UPI0016652A03|nr:hypothetical protein [Streptomyces albiflavescens]